MYGNEMRTKIIDVGTRLFLRKGYNGAAISEIMKTVNISKPAFYWYFHSKNELLEAIIDEFDLRFLDNLIATIENSDSKFLGKFKLSHKITTEFAYNHKDLCLAFVTLSAELTGTGDPIDEKITGVNKKFVDFYTRLIDLGKQEGVIDENIESRSIANIIVGNHHGVLLQWHVSSAGNSFDGANVAKSYLNVLLLGLLKKI
jgi:TetR/AcrR family transcriptional regulator, transcriptional repressor for nem operon